MKHDPTIKRFLLATLAAFAMACTVHLCCGVQHAGATQPECTGDRHYDEIGECCPVPTTTTTLPGGECEACAPVLPCPDPAPCQPVVCENGMDGTTTVVTVDRCPQPEVSEVCKVRRNGTVVCPRSKATRDGKHKPGPRKIYVPRSIIDQIADVESYN